MSKWLHWLAIIILAMEYPIVPADTTSDKILNLVSSIVFGFLVANLYYSGVRAGIDMAHKRD